MSEIKEEEKEMLAEMDRKIAELEKKKTEMLTPPPEIPEEVPEIPEIVGIVPDTPENRKIMEKGMRIGTKILETISDIVKKPINPELEKILVEEISKNTGIPKSEFEGGIYIEWIDHRYHINGVRGIPNGNRIIVRSLKSVDSLIRHLQYARDAFNQKEMIDTKNPK